MSDRIDLVRFRFKVLFSFYRNSQGRLATIVWSHTVAQDLSIEEKDATLFERTVRFLKDEFLIVGKALGGGYSLTYQAFDEVEGAIIRSHVPTMHFPPNIAMYSYVGENTKEDIINIRKKRSSFLKKAYEISAGDSGVMMKAFEIGKLLGFDEVTINKVYEYLEESGRIEYRFLGGGFSISHAGLKEIEEPMLDTPDLYDISIWTNSYPTLEFAYDKIIDLLDEINIKCQARIGCKIFMANAKVLKEFRNDIESLRNDSRNRNAFVLLVARVASIIDEVDTQNIGRRISMAHENKSLNLITALFDCNDISYSIHLFKTLRMLRDLRNKISPIHSADHKANEIYQYIGIDPNSDNWGRAADLYVTQFINCLEMISSALTPS